MRTVFMGTPDFAVPCLETLYRERYPLVGVVTQPDRPKGRGQKLAVSPVKAFALAHNLPVYQPESIKDEAFLATLAELAPQIIVVVAFGQILPKAVLTLPRYGCINVHASLLPRYRGAAPIHWAIINGEAVTGVTTMFMDEGMDTGDMILKAEVPITPEDTVGTLHDKLAKRGASLLLETLALVAAGRAPREPQDHRLATYAPLLKREHERIDWTKPASSVHNLVRGLNPWPGAYTYHGGRSIKVWRTQPVSGADSPEPAGTVLAVDDTGIIVATGQGRLRICAVQPESGKKISGADYARGYKLKAGDRLGGEEDSS